VLRKNCKPLVGCPPARRLIRPSPRYVFCADRTCKQDSAGSKVSQPPFPEDARWNAERAAVEFGDEGGPARNSNDYCRTPPRCVEAHYLRRTGFENII
jgi:hypothetical protein